MSTYGKKNKGLVKNQRSLLYEIQKRKNHLHNKYSPLLKQDENIKNNDITNEVDFKKLYESIMKITDVSSINRPKVLDGEHKAIYYTQQKTKAPKRQLTEKQLSGVEKLYSDLSGSLFENIIAAPKQTAKELQQKNIEQLENINYSMNVTKANMTYQTVEEAYKKALEATVVAYDLETYGGTSSKTKIWSPRGITEFSFQEMNVNKYLKDTSEGVVEDFDSYISKKTAVIGMSEEEMNLMYDKIEKTLKATDTIADEELRITARRMQMYAHANFIKKENGITVVEGFPGEEVFKGGYNLDKIKEGFKKFVDAKKHAEKFINKETGLLPYHDMLFREISRIQNNNITVLDYNGLNFDQPVLNGIMNSIMANEYKDNEIAQNSIKNMFKNGNVVFDPQVRLDAMGVFKEASEIAGVEAVYGANANKILRDVHETGIYRQEKYMEVFNPNLMDGMERHQADTDTTNLIRAVFEKLEHFDNSSPFENALNIITKDRTAKGKDIIVSKERMGNYVFKSRGEISSEGRDILDFTYDENNKTFRMRSKHIVGGNDEVSIANKGVVHTGFNVGGATTKGAYYKIGGMHKHKLSDKELNYLTDIAPEFANRHLYVLKLDPYFANDEQREMYSDQANSIYRVFTSKDKLEAAISNDLELVAKTKNDGNLKLVNRDDFKVNIIGKTGTRVETDEEIANLTDIDLLTRGVNLQYAKRVEESSASHISYKTAQRTLNYHNLKDEIKKHTGKEVVDMKTHLKEARRVSEAISRNEDMTTDKQYGIYNLVKTHLGFEDRNVNKQQLYTNTLNNYIRTSEFYDELSPIANEIRGHIKNKDKYAIEIKMQSALDYIVDEFAKQHYKDENYLFGDLKEIKMTNSEMRNVFQIDVSKFQSERRNAHKIRSNVSTMDEDAILSINLNTSYKNLSERIRDLVYGDNDKKKGMPARATAMADFIEFLKEEGVAGGHIDNLNTQIKSGKLKNPVVMAEKLVHALRAEKEQDVTRGIIRNTIGNFNPLEDKELVKNLKEYIKTDEGKELVKRGIKQTPSVKQLDVNSIVDNILMPSVFKGGEKLTGTNALKHILETNEATVNSNVEKDLFIDHWNVIKRSHTKNVELLSDLIYKTGGELITVDDIIYAKYGDEAIAFDSLAKTRYRYGTLEHVVDKTAVAAHMNLDATIGKGGVQVDFVSNLEQISSSIRKFKGKIEEANKQGKLSSEIIDLFRGKISKDMREESRITNYNIHERMAQNKLGVGHAFGEIMPQLVGVDTDAILKGNEMFDEKAMTILKEEILKLGDNYKGKLTPQMTEAFIKNAVPLLDSFENLSPTVRKYLPYISFSTKDNDIGGKSEINLFISSDRYMQGPSVMYDAPKRPTLQAGKIDYDKADIEKGMNDYLQTNKDKIGMVGSIFEDKKKSRTTTGIGISQIESAVTVKKANIGNIALNSILNNNMKKILDENKVDFSIEIEGKKLNSIFAINRLLQKVSLQEQEKVMDSRLMDSVFEHSFNVQHIRGKNLEEYYTNKFNVDDFLNNLMNDLGVSEVDKQLAIKESQIANRLADNSIQFKYVDGKIQVHTPEGELVERGDKLLSYYDRFNPHGKVSSKIDIGRFQHGVFEESGNLRLKDEQIAEFLNKNLRIIEGESEEDLTKRAMNLLDENFKVNYFVSDIRQNAYAKYMNDAVEKDMTYGLYESLGSLDEKIKASLKGYSYQGKNMDMLLGKIIKKSELDIILKDYKGVKGGYNTLEELMSAIDKERHFLSDVLFRHVDEFRDVSVLANHQTGKHQNYGMISENVISSVFESIYKKQDSNNKSKKAAMETLIEALTKYDVFDKDTMELKSDGSAIYIKPKTGKDSHSQYGNFGESNILEDVRYLRLGGTDKNGNEIGLKGMIKEYASELYHKEARYYNDKTKSIETMEVYGEVEFGTFKYTNSAGEEVVADNVALMSKGLSRLQQAIDPETMTSYDVGVINALTLKRDGQKELLDLKTKAGLKHKLFKKEFYKNFDRENSDMTKEEIAEAADMYVQSKMEGLRVEAEDKIKEANYILSGYEEHSSPKKIGKQEFGLYSRAKWNYSTVQAMENFVNADNISEETMLFRREFIRRNTGAVIEEIGEGKYELKEGFEGKSAYRLYTEDLIASKVFNERTDIELNNAYFKLDEYKDLRDIKSEILKVSEELGEGRVSIRYAQELHQAKSAIQATEFNYGTNRISVEQMNELGFDTITAKELITHGVSNSLMKESEETDSAISTIFNKNHLLYLGDDFGGEYDTNAYIALPKAGKVLEDTEISKKFQSKVFTLQEMLKEYNTGDFLSDEGSDSDYATNLRNRIIKKASEIRKDIRAYTYDKDGILHDMSTVYVEDAFRLKFSFVNNTHNIEGAGDNSIITSLIDKDSEHMLKKAKVNGISIADLEKNGIYTDYAFVSEDVFKRLGYFNEDRMMTLPDVKSGKYAWNSDEAIGQMKERLKTDGIIANTGRYPMIMDDSEKATRIFLGDMVESNRARVSVVTALSMNADNDGDSASFSILKVRGANGFNDYLQYKIDGGTERAAQFFGEIEARMAYKAAGINNHYFTQSMEDLKGEMSAAIENGTINNKMTSIRNKALFNEVMYANYGQSPNTRMMIQNKTTLDKYAAAAQELSPDLKDLVPIDIKEINASTKNTTNLADYYDAHIKVLKEAEKNNPGTLKSLGLGDNAIDDFTENAITRAMWYESLAEAQSKGRKGSIGPINVSLQGIRTGADALYNNDNSKDAIIKHNISGLVAHELEQEVISAKHGSVVTNIDKARELRKLTDNFISDSSDENKQLLLDFFDGTGESKATNLDDKTIKKIWDKLETSGIVNKDMLGNYIEGGETLAKRNYIGERYTQVLRDIGKSDDAKRAMAFNKIGGSGADFHNNVAPIDIDSAGKFMSAVINNDAYEANKAKREISEATQTISHKVHFTDALENSINGNIISDMAGSLKGRGLALGALSVAVGVLASGFAGSPVDQSGANELAKQEEMNRDSSNSSPIFLDQGQQVTRSSSRGYIINMKASSNRDTAQTKKALRQAASESVGGGVNVNMTIQNREVSNSDIEQFITGL